MMEKINYKELSFDSYDATYKNLIYLSDEKILNILNEMRDFEDIILMGNSYNFFYI